MTETETITTTTGDATAAGHEQEQEHEHPSDLKYIQIAIILAVLTAAEVATYYVDIGPLEIPVLLGLMTVKFILVIMWFMHLKFDSPLFTRTFIAGLVLAVVVYCSFLSIFEFWS